MSIAKGESLHQDKNMESLTLLIFIMEEARFYLRLHELIIDYKAIKELGKLMLYVIRFKLHAYKLEHNLNPP